MGLGVNFPELSRNIELFFKEKICELSSRDDEPGGALVHGGLAVVAAEGITGARGRGRSGEWELAVIWGKRGGSGGVLTKGFGGRFDGEARPAAVKGEQRR
jgi:hypothetical protein